MSGLGTKIAKGAGWTVALRLMDRSVGLISTLILARLLVPADFGLVAMATSLVALLEAISAFGFEWALIQKQTTERKYFDSAWTMNVLLAGAQAVLLVLLIVPSIAFYNEPRVGWIMVALAVSAAVSGFRNIGMVFFEKEIQFRPLFILSLTKRLSMFAVTISLAFYWQSYWALVAGMLTGTVVDLVLSYVLHPYRPRFSLEKWRELFGFSKWMLGSNLVYFVSHRGQDFIIGNRAGASALGIYSLAYEVANLPTSELVYPITRAVFPGYAQMASDRARLTEGFCAVFRLCVAFALPAAIGIACLAELIVDVLLGPKWTEAIPLISVLALAGAVRATQANTGSLYMAMGLPRTLMLVGVINAVLLLPLIFIVLPIYGLIGAAWVVFGVFFAASVINFTIIGRLLNLGPLAFIGPLVRPLLASAAMAGFILWVRATFGDSSNTIGEVAEMLGLIIAGAAIYAGTLLGMWRLMGRPAGVEADLLGFARRFIAQRFARTA